MTQNVVRAKRLWSVRDMRAGDVGLPLLAVSIHHGVVPRSQLTEDEPRADDLSVYKLVIPGDIVVNRMRAFQGAVGVAPSAGVVSPDYLVLEPRGVSPRYLHYLMRSRWMVGEMSKRLRGIGSVDQGNVRTPRINIDELGEIPIPCPSPEDQEEIADFLDAETGRIDRLIELRLRSRELQSERFESAVFAAVSRGLRGGAATKPSGLQWVDRIPAHWGTPAVSVNFELALGKMLNAESAAGPAQHPYLRNVNVQWDRIDLGDLATMSFDEKEFSRYGLRSGDVLICEGGEVGRAAVWSSELDNCFFQKAIHRARPRRGANGRHLMYCLRAAAKRSVFSVEGNQSTIVHLTGEQLRVHRFPWPPPDEQRDIVEHLDRLAEHHASISRAMDAHVGLLQERKQALITAAVTGQFGLAREIAEEAS